MTGPSRGFDADDEDEPPLDPAMQRVQQRLRRMLFVSALTLGVGLFAVLFAILYRINNVPDGIAVAGTIELPAGATVLSTSLDGDRVAFTLDLAGERLLSVHELSTGRHLGTARLVAR